MAEAGLPGYAATGYVGIMTTGGTPHDVIAKINAAINEIVREQNSPPFPRPRLRDDGGAVEEFATFIRDDTDRYARLMREIDGTVE
jgi:tripartite-type tricarboxylate transporter receptor subunit TctC